MLVAAAVAEEIEDPPRAAGKLLERGFDSDSIWLRLIALPPFAAVAGAIALLVLSFWRSRAYLVGPIAAACTAAMIGIPTILQCWNEILWAYGATAGAFASVAILESAVVWRVWRQRRRPPLVRGPAP